MAQSPAVLGARETSSSASAPGQKEVPPSHRSPPACTAPARRTQQWLEAPYGPSPASQESLWRIPGTLLVALILSMIRERLDIGREVLPAETPRARGGGRWSGRLAPSSASCLLTLRESVRAGTLCLGLFSPGLVRS